MEIMGILTLVNLFFAVVIGLYFWNLLRQQQTSRSAVERESRKELEKLAKLKAISLTEPLAEKTRPSRFEEIVGQEDGLKALRAALCGPNPQHVIIYGPPGVGKTAAARLVLEEAKRNPLSPFGPSARFVEVDATPPASTTGASPTRCWARCTTPFIRARGPWESPASRSPSRGR